MSLKPGDIVTDKDGREWEVYGFPGEYPGGLLIQPAKKKPRETWVSSIWLDIDSRHSRKPNIPCGDDQNDKWVLVREVLEE